MHENFSKVIEMGWSSRKSEPQPKTKFPHLHPDIQHQKTRRQTMVPIQSQEQF